MAYRYYLPGEIKMDDYSLIETVLAGTFSSSVGFGEDEAISELRKDIESNPVFRKGIEDELKKAFLDHDLSWRALFLEHNVCFFENEDEARSYARKILWDIVFEP